MLCLLIDFDAPPQATAERTWPFQIPLIADSGWGESDRTADHATVAINDDGDILVAYHTTRTDIDNIPTKPAFHEPLKQVEIALFRYDGPNDEWDLVQRELIGSTEHDPKDSSEQDQVRCERPDVIAVGNRFFVVWTRRYDRNMGGLWQAEPAVLECAWVEWNDTTETFDIHNNDLGDGKGFALDIDYTIRECAGSPDAVLLDPGDANTGPTVGVVYPHQSNFGDSYGGNDLTRRCDLRLVTVTISSSDVVDSENPLTLNSYIPFHGPTAPSGQVAEGFILPECARAQGTFRFWLAYEDQRAPDSGNIPDGRIHLELWEFASNEWDTVGSMTLGTHTDPHYLRRPMLSSCPEEANGGLDRVSLTFSVAEDETDNDVIHDEWVINSLGFSKLISAHFENDINVSHNRPTILHGRDDPITRRLYVGEVDDPTDLLEYDVDADSETVRRSADALSRPAVAYRVGTPDDFVLTWEEQVANEDYFRIWLRVD